MKRLFYICLIIFLFSCSSGEFNKREKSLYRLGFVHGFEEGLTICLDTIKNGLEYDPNIMNAKIVMKRMNNKLKESGLEELIE